MFSFLAGGDRVAAWLSPTKLHAVDWDITADHRDVPAMFVMFSSCDSHFL